METEVSGAETTAVGMPQLDIAIYPNLIFWLLISIGVLYLIMTRVALPRIGTVLGERNDAIAGDIEQAAMLKRRAEEAEAAYTAALARARDESSKIAAETKAQINKELSALMSRAEAEIAAKSAESERRIREIQASAAASVEQVAREAGIAIVNAFLPGPGREPAVADAVANRLRG